MAQIESIQQIAALTKALGRQYEVSFGAMAKGAETWDKFLGTVRPTKKKAMTFPFLYPIATVSEYEIGQPLAARSAIGGSVEIEVKKWGDKVTLMQTDFEDPDQHQMLREHVDQLGIAMGRVRQRQILRALRLGDTDTDFLVYDGDQLFSTSHEVGFQKSAWSNLFTTALTGPVLQDTINNFHIIPYAPPDNSDEPYLPVDGATFYLIVHPNLKDTAAQILHNEYLFQTTNTATSSNVYSADSLNTKLLVSAQLQDTNDWYVAMVLPGQGGKPFVTVEQQVAGTGALVPLTKPDQSNVIEEDRFEWAIKRFEKTFPTQFFLLAKHAVT